MDECECIGFPFFSLLSPHLGYGYGNSCIIIPRLRDYRLPLQEVFDVDTCTCMYVYCYHISV